MTLLSGTPGSACSACPSSRPSAQQQLVFRIVKTPENAQYWELLEASQRKWDVEFCYCSVFDECWKVLGKWDEPGQLEACVRVEAREFLP